jgi:tRNA-dihydrouridine synthase B
MIKIRNLKLKNRLFLAPMLEPNDIAFRLLCKESGCGLTFTGMIHPLYSKKIILDDKPALQLFANSPRGIKRFIKKYDKDVSLWDFNLGCPSKNSKKMEHGAFMHKDIENIKKIFRALRSSTDKPCSVKLRKSDYAIEIAKLAETEGFDLVCIHPRTQTQGYSGEPDYDFALKLKKALKVPVVYSGNVNSENYKKILKDFDFVMFGRSAIGNPTIFSEGKKKIRFEDYLELAKKYDLSFARTKYQALNFSKGMRNSKKLRARIIKTKNVEELF